MAIYHLTVKVGSKERGESACKKSNYILRTGTYKAKAKELQFAHHGNMPKWPKRNPQQDGQIYWQACDEYERENGRLFREVEFALPRELTPEQQQELAVVFAEHLASVQVGRDTLKLPFSLAIHCDAKGSNPHCHLMLSERVNDGIPRNASTWFKRANTKEPKKGGARKIQDLCSKDWLLKARADWQEFCNTALQKADPNFDLETDGIDCRSHKVRGIHKLPTVHEGKAGTMYQKTQATGWGKLACQFNATARRLNHLEDRLNRTQATTENAHWLFELNQLLSRHKDMAQGESTQEGQAAFGRELDEWESRFAHPGIQLPFTELPHLSEKMMERLKAYQAGKPSPSPFKNPYAAPRPSWVR